MRASAIAPWGLVVLAFGLALAVSVMSGCEDALGAGGRRGGGETGSRVDSGVLGGGRDGAATSTAGVDAGASTAGDAGEAADTGGIRYFDAMASNPADSGVGTGGSDGGVGTGGSDSGVGTGGSDSGIASAPDARVFPDAAPVFADAAPVFADASTGGTGEVWIEIDYSNANTSRSPTFRYSNTPGWGAAQWAAVNANGPEAWDRFNNMSVVNDPIGRSLEIGGSSELQLMLGFEELIAYSSATVRIEGRSRATSSQVTFDVYNPWNGCGAGGATLGQQWQVQVVELDLADCYEIGQGVQAVRVDPTNGTIALVRLRLTLHDAVY